MGYQSLLVAIDTSGHAEEVITAAQRLAQPNHASLLFVTVIPPILQVYGAMDFAGYSAANLSLEGEAIKAAEQRFDNLRKKFGLGDASLLTPIGSPTSEIVNLAGEQNVDLIVIGSGHHSGLRRLLGSTATGVLHHSPCDVLIVHQNERAVA